MREKAFEAIVDTYQERLYWHIRRMVLSHDNADDVLQNTFIKIWKGLASFRGDSKVYTWLYRIATNEALSFLKANKTETVDFDKVEYSQSHDLQSDVYYNGDEIHAKLMEALETLPEKQKLVFNLKYFDEMKYEEMSDVLGTSVGALKASYHHAVNKIKEHLLQKH